MSSSAALKSAEHDGLSNVQCLQFVPLVLAVRTQVSRILLKCLEIWRGHVDCSKVQDYAAALQIASDPCSGGSHLPEDLRISQANKEDFVQATGERLPCVS